MRCCCCWPARQSGEGPGGDVAQAGTLLRRVFYSRKALDILASPTPFRSLRLQREGSAPFRAHQSSTHTEPGDLESSSDFASSPSALVSTRGRRVSRCLSFASTATCWPRMALPSASCQASKLPLARRPSAAASSIQPDPRDPR